MQELFFTMHFNTVPQMIRELGKRYYCKLLKKYFLTWIDFRININLFNPDTGTTAWDPSVFQDASNDFSLASSTTTMTLTGTNLHLLSWDVGDEVYINNWDTPSPGNPHPDGATYFAENCARYCHKLDSLDNQIERDLIAKQHRQFLVYHPAWSYFAHDYNLQELSIEQDGKAPTLRGMQNVIRQAQENHIHVVFASPQFNQASAAQIAREINGRVIQISPLEPGYFKNIARLGQLLKQTME